ncbi:MAG: SMP-30/gluconolactonase/LRE family protein [Planctomycetota bacterium]
MTAPLPSAPTRRRRAALLLAAPALVLAYLLLWPTKVDPVAFASAPAPSYPPNDRLAHVEVLGRGLRGPEDVAVDAHGRIYAGLEDGWIARLRPDGHDPELLLNTGGRPLGLAFAADGRLLVADADRGLLAVDPTRRVVEVLSTEAEGGPYGFADDLDVARDGTVYFSDASSRFGWRTYKQDLLEHAPNGRLLAWDPRTRRTRVLLRGLFFANGVAVSADQRFVLVNETGQYRVTRYWLEGPKAGTSDVFCDDLPGFPDGISARPGGGFWLALASPRDPALDALAPYPFARKVVSRLPEALQPAPQRHAWVLGLDAEGKVVADLQHRAPDSFSPVTSVEEWGGKLYLGSLSYPGLARIPAPQG